MKLTSIFYSALWVLLFFSCTSKEEIKPLLNSSIEILSKQPYIGKVRVHPLNDSQYIELKINHLRLKNLSNRATIKELTFNLSEFNFPVLAVEGDSLLYLVKPPDGLSKVNPDVATALTLNLNSWTVTDSFAIHDPLMEISKNRLMHSSDSIVCAYPVNGLIYNDQKLFFPLFRWVPMQHPNFFQTEMPALAYYDLMDKKVVYTSITSPFPTENNLLEIHNRPSITQGPKNQLLVHFQYSDSVALYNMKTNEFQWKRTQLPYTPNPKGLTQDQLKSNLAKGITTAHHQDVFNKIYYIKARNEYVRFGKVKLDTMLPTQINSPLYNYSTYDTKLIALKSGILPQMAAPALVNFHTDKSYLFSAKGTSQMLYEFDFLSNAEDSYTELNAFKNLASFQTGWPAYFSKVHNNQADTIRTLIIPEESCPTCVMGVLNREQGIQTMNKYGYDMLFLSNKKYASNYIDVGVLSQKLTTLFDSHKYLPYVASFVNPKLLVIANGQIVIDEHINPEEAKSLENIILQMEAKLHSKS